MWHGFKDKGILANFGWLLKEVNLIDQFYSGRSMEQCFRKH